MMWRIAGVMVAAGLVAGCATYQREKQDLVRGGGQSQRLADANERLANARAEQLALREDQQSAQQELASVRQELAAVNRNRSVREGQIVQARSQARITAAEETRLRNQLAQRSDNVKDKALEVEAARASGSASQIARKEDELRKLKAELATTNREIAALQ